MRFALCLGPCEEESALLVRRMLAALPGAASGSARVYSFASGALGVLARDGRDSELSHRVLASDSRVTIAACDPICVAEPVRTVLERAHRSDNAANEFTSLDGSFVAVQVDARSGRHVVVTDFIGMAPAFQARREGALLISTTPSALLVDTAVSEDPDPAGWGALLGFGNAIGNTTKLAAVRRLPSAAVLEFDSAGALLGERRYWSWPHESGDRRFGAGDVVELLGGSVAAYRREYTADTVLLSGGFDSRIIAGLLQRRGDTPRGLIQRHPDENANADGRFGVLAARSMGLPYEVHDVSRDFFSSHDYLAYLHEADVDVQSLYLFIATTARLLNPSRGAVWLDTVVGSLVKRNAVADSPEDYARRIMQSDQLEARLSSLQLFTREWRAAMHAGARESLAAEMAGIPATRQGSRELRNRTRVRTRIGAHFHRVHSGRVPVATPGLDRNSWSLSMGVSLEAATARELLHQLLRAYMPAAARVPFASGTRLSRVLPVAAPQLLLQRCLSAGQNALRRRPLRGISRAIGIRPFDWEPSAFLRDLEQRVADSRGIVDMDAVAGTRTPQEDAALFYWCEFGSVIARAREAMPREAQVISLAAGPESAGV